MHRISFTHAHSYAGRDAGITLPVVLLSSIAGEGGRRVPPHELLAGFSLLYLRQHVRKSTSAFVMERYGRLPEMDRSFDIAYWQRLGPSAIFEAAWQMVVDAHSGCPGGSDELRLCRIVEQFQ